MLIGLDWFGTITKEPELFALVTSLLKQHGDIIYIISAVRKKEWDENAERYKQKVLADLKENNIVFDELYTVEFEDPKEVPYVKLEKCKELKIEYFFDDRNDVCFILNENGIITARV